MFGLLINVHRFLNRDETISTGKVHGMQATAVQTENRSYGG